MAGAAVLSWPGQMQLGAVLPALAALGACLLWALDNNLTRKVALVDSSFIAMTKGLAAGADVIPAGTWHSHPHRHDRTAHAHDHFPDAHHRHEH